MFNYFYKRSGNYNKSEKGKVDNMESDINSLNTLNHTSVDYEAIIDKIREDNKILLSFFIHELRNPLALMDSTIQYIETIHPEVSSFKYWDQLYELINEMVTMTSDVSILNKCHNLNKQEANLLSLLQDISDSYMPIAVQKQLDLEFINQPGCDSYFTSYNCDANKLKHSISNLIKNAIEATTPGSFIHIETAYMNEDNTLPPSLSIQISNNGSQIPKDDIDKIFLPFITYKKNGTGVGLALVKKIIELHYGTISVQSNDNLTTFTILLPL